MPDAVIVSATRSPIGRARKGSLVTMRPDDMAAQVVRAALDPIPELDPREIDDLMMGCARPIGEAGRNIARLVAVQLGYDHLPGTTVMRACSSSLQTTRMAFHAIRSGEGSAFISAGVEAVSRYPNGRDDGGLEVPNPIYDAARARTAACATGAGPTWEDPRASDGLPDVYIDMGQTAENVAEYRNVSRTDMDHFAVRSQQLAERSTREGFWSNEITPIRLYDGTAVATDDCPRFGVTYHAVAQLAPVFRPEGRVTAGNACPLNDGAAAVVVMSDTRAAELGIAPLARIVSTAVSGLSPEIMGLGPVEATQRALANAGMSINDIDLVEINEAFAAQVIASQRDLGIDLDRLNVNGGAIALGHPFGMTGARITTTLINLLRGRDKQFGLETMCVGGGQGMAMIIERLA